jgi:hypothetical protein
MFSGTGCLWNSIYISMIYLYFGRIFAEYVKKQSIGLCRIIDAAQVYKKWEEKKLSIRTKRLKNIVQSKVLHILVGCLWNDKF